jgi:integrase
MLSINKLEIKMATIEKRKAIGGTFTYRVKVRLKGKMAESATFIKLADAKKWAQQTEYQIKERIYFNNSDAKKRTLSDAIDRYIKTGGHNKYSTFKNQISQFKFWKETIGHYLLIDITPSTIAQVRDKLSQAITIRKKRRTTATVNRYLSALSHLFTIATKEWEWVNENPVMKVNKLKENRGRNRFLSNEERDRLLDNSLKSKNPHLYMIITLCLSTGARKMEILSLKWKQVDLKRQILTIEETKNGERRILPLTTYTLSLLEIYYNSIKEHYNENDLLFPGKINYQRPIEIRDAFKTVLRRSGIIDFRFHDLRHSAASYLAMNGASLPEISEVLGHKTFQMVKRYAHLSESHIAKVVEKMNQHIFNYQ